MYKDSDYIIASIFGRSFRTKTDLELEILKDVVSIFHDCDVIEKEKYKVDGRTKIIKYERPDLVIISDDYAIIIEHFEANTSKLTKKGYEHSKYYTDKYNEAISDKLIEELKHGNNFAKQTEITKAVHSFDNLISNIIMISDNHYVKISDYKERVRNEFNIPNHKIYIAFFVECTQVLPTFIVDKEDNISIITPTDDIRIIEYLRDKEQIDGMIVHIDETSNSDCYNGFILNMKNNLDDINADGVNYYDLNSIEVHDLSQPMRATIMGKINKDN